jgi:hypothetical protein
MHLSFDEAEWNKLEKKYNLSDATQSTPTEHIVENGSIDQQVLEGATFERGEGGYEQGE